VDIPGVGTRKIRPWAACSGHERFSRSA
jgi:hypothetical protein